MYDIDDYLAQYQALLNKARLWSLNHKNSTYLLVGEERKNAEIWLKYWFEVQDGLPEPKPLHYKFIEESYRQDFYDVLIIYDCKNLEFTIQLQAELVDQGFRVWCKHNSNNHNNKKFDQHEFIQRSDHILLLIDENFLSSEACTQELQIANRYNKHIISILLDENIIKINPNRFPNLIHYKSENFSDLIKTLSQQIKENKIYLRNHSYFLVKALEWEWYSKPISSLLIGDELTGAAQWLEQSKEQEVPCQPIEIHRQYIEESVKSSQAFFDAFISYGRPDSLAFVNRIYQELTKKGYRIWFDMQEIPYAVNYQKQIDNGNERAKNFIFIMAPHAVNSPYCGQEIELAVKYNKRLIPVLHVPEIDEKTWKERYPHKDWETAKQKGEYTSDRNPNLHPALYYPNWIRYSDDKNFDKLIEALDNLLKTGTEYIDQHTYILDKALEWERHEKRTEYLLVGEERKQAEKWLLTEFKNQQSPCEPSLLHCEYIAQSKKNANNLMTQVFICGATNDEPLKEKITHSLMRKGFSVWSSTSDLRLGESPEEGIKRGIDEADNILDLLSLDAVVSSDCQLQLEQSRSRHKRIFTLLVGEIKELPSDHIIDFTNPEMYDESLQTLLRGLNEDASYYERHKILLAKALKWKQQQDNVSLLLRGYNLREAETWLKQAQQKTLYSATPEQEEFINASLRQPSAGSLDVFISYSRADSDFARKLNDQLQMRGKTTWFDQESIATGVDFGQEIKRGIETSDNFVFIISPRSVKSPYCADEVNYAKSLNKRLITVLHRPVNETDLEISGLGGIQWLDFYHSERDFNDLLSQLVRTIDTDRDHLHLHTELSLKALEWEAKKRDLLSETELVSAKAWLETAESYKKQPPPTELQRQFIGESGKALEAGKRKEKRQIRNLRLVLAGMSVAFVAAVGVSAVALNLQRQAKILQASAIGRYAAPTFNDNKQLEALEEAIKGGRELQQLGATDGWVVAALQKVIYGINERTQLKHDDTVTNTIYSPDGQMIATVSIDKKVHLWNKQGQKLYTFPHSDPIIGIAFSPDSNKIASASGNQTILWNIKGEKLQTLEHNDIVYSVTFSPDGKIIASTSRDKTVKLWNTQGQLLHTLKHDNWVVSAGFTPDSKIIASASYDKTVKLWDVQGRLLHTLPHNSVVNSLIFSPDGKTLASASDDKTVKLWNTNGKKLQTLIHDDKVPRVVFSPDNQLLASMCGNKIILWNSQGQQLKILTHNAPVYSLMFSPDGKMIASASADKTIKIWDIQGKEIKVFRHKTSVTTVAFSPNSKTIAAGDKEGLVKLWQLEHNQPTTVINPYQINEAVFSRDGQTLALVDANNRVSLRNIQGTEFHQLNPDDKVYQVAFSPDGQTLASASADSTVKLWNIQGQLLNTLPHQSEVFSLAFSPNGKTLASASADSTVKLWNIQGKLLQTLPHQSEVNKITFSPKGKMLASVSADRTVKLWNLQGQLLETLSHDNPVKYVLFSPDEQVLVSIGLNNTFRLWSLDGKLLHTFSHNSNRDHRVSSIAFSPDGQKLATSSYDNSVKLWNLQGQELMTVHHDNFVNRVIFSPDGNMLISASGDKTVKVWTLNGKELQSFIHSSTVSDIIFSYDGKFLASLSHNKLILWDFDLDNLINKACNWAQDYLTYSQTVIKEKRNRCQGMFLKNK